jgi:hypothetical protein
MLRLGAHLGDRHVDFGDHETSPNHVGTIMLRQDQARLPTGGAYATT